MSRAPSEFRYWDNLDKPWARALRTAMRVVMRRDPAPPDDVVETLASMYYDADPLAEAFVDEVYLGRSASQGRAMLDLALAEGVDAVADAPDSLRALFADIESDPTWVDPAMVELGARVFRRYGPAVFHFAGAITLWSYSENSVAKPLMLTGAYAGASTKHRFGETAAFWIAVSEPGGLHHGAPGRASAMRVRIMHVFVRRRLMAHPEWDLDAWGVPISQADALLTLMGGSAAPGVAMRAMGYRPTAREQDALLHFWRYAGHLMGVRPRWWPASMAEVVGLGFVTLVKGAHLAGDDGRQLCQSYARMFESAFAEDDSEPSLGARLRAAWDHRINLGYTRFFLPGWTYRANRLPAAGLWALHPLVRAPFIFGAETLRRHVPALDELADRMARRSRDRWFARHMGGREAEYRPAQHFTR